MKNYFSWLVDNDRPLNISFTFVIGVMFGFNCAMVASITAEFKDWLWNGAKGGVFGWIQGNGFDWLDFSASMIGAISGALIRFFVL